MRTKKTAHGIGVQKVPFAFPSDFHAPWHPGDPALSQLINGTAILLPSMEPFIINAIRHASEHVTDPQLRAEAKAWMREGVALYDQGEKGLAKLDATKLEQSPTGMLPAGSV
jgi:predicted metal-dependent hydrolase